MSDGSESIYCGLTGKIGEINAPVQTIAAVSWIYCKWQTGVNKFRRQFFRNQEGFSTDYMDQIILIRYFLRVNFQEEI